MKCENCGKHGGKHPPAQPFETQGVRIWIPWQQKVDALGKTHVFCPDCFDSA